MQSHSHGDRGDVEHLPKGATPSDETSGKIVGPVSAYDPHAGRRYTDVWLVVRAFEVPDYSIGILDDTIAAADRAVNCNHLERDRQPGARKDIAGR